MSLRDKLLGVLVLLIGLALTYYVIWPVVAFVLKWSFLVVFTIAWIVALAGVGIHYWLKWSNRNQVQVREPD